MKALSIVQLLHAVDGKLLFGEPEGANLIQRQSYQESPRRKRPATGDHGRKGVLPLVSGNAHSG